MRQVDADEPHRRAVPPATGDVLHRGKRHVGVNRSIGYVTQADNLYPWRTLRQNIEFPLELRMVSKDERRERAERLIHRVGLAGFEDSYPHELSGGMRQRANIIRTLIYEPEVILMDEPFGPLDAQTRLILQNQLLELWHEERKTIIFITHDLGEAIALADRVVVMSARPGRIKTIARGADLAPARPVRNPCRRPLSRELPCDVGELGGGSQERSRAMASTDLTKTPDTALPPGAANVEDDLQAFEAEERREQAQADGRTHHARNRSSRRVGIRHRPLV